MQRQDFTFDLPDRLIADAPLENRSDSRLLALTEQGVEHCQFMDLLGYLQPGDLLVMNNTRVLPARIFATKQSGGRAEVML